MADASPLDIVYIFRHSKSGDEELRYSLRSVAANLPYIRKVWIFGDRPEFLANDDSVIEHVPHEYVAPLLGLKVPVRNDFQMVFLASLIPGLQFEFMRFSDDYVVLQSVSRAELRTARVVEDLNQVSSRGSGQFKEMLWRTFDALRRYGYAGFNFESHMPQPFNKRIVFEAFMAFRSFLSEERYGGLVSATSIFNYALKHGGLEWRRLADDSLRAGFYGACPAASESIAASCRGKAVLFPKILSASLAEMSGAMAFS